MQSPFSMVPGGMDAFAALTHAASATQSSALSADQAAIAASVGAALGPIGLGYLVSFMPAFGNNLASGHGVAHVLAAVGDSTIASKAAGIAFDNA